jgi:hypothetical protein
MIDIAYEMVVSLLADGVSLEESLDIVENNFNLTTEETNRIFWRVDWEGRVYAPAKKAG